MNQRSELLFWFGAAVGATIGAIVFCGCTPGTWRVTEENDYFTLFNKDHDYTQGLTVSHDDKERRITAGQRIFTPVHKKLSPAPPGERPYAGYIFSEYRKLGVEVDGNRPYYGAEFGLVGPGAFGEEAQCGVHKLLGQGCPAGWPEQLNTEPGFILKAGSVIEQEAEFLFTKGSMLYNFDIEAGTISTALIMGSTVRYRLASWLYAFAGPQLHVVARDIFLDGNTFSDSSSVTRKWLFQEVTGGFEFLIPKMPRITWFMRVQSKQYDEQEGTYNYGGVEFAWEN